MISSRPRAACNDARRQLNAASEATSRRASRDRRVDGPPMQHAMHADLAADDLVDDPVVADPELPVAVERLTKALSIPIGRLAETLLHGGEYPLADVRRESTQVVRELRVEERREGGVARHARTPPTGP